jgi:glucosamine--fructose-6-phosphate aminotransferase (isomerizing)
LCGIIGYVGFRKASEVILKGLKKLEYRGYDSAGIATIEGSIKIIKETGKIEEIDKTKNFTSLEGKIGIGHTRWATHGKVSTENAHPHTDSEGKISLVHNGIIENFEELKEQLEKKEHRFKSQTDTEIIAHLIEEELKNSKNFLEAFKKAISKLTGSWSIVCIYEKEPAIFLSRNGPPLIIGIGKDEMFCASDVPALLEYTKKVIFLEDQDIAVLKKDSYEIFSGEKALKRKIHEIEWTAEMAQKDGYPHFMLKEINEQQNKIKEALAADVSKAAELLKKQKIITVVACGSSYYAGLGFKNILNKFGIFCNVIVGSEFSNSKTGKEKVIVAISQSGETADTLAAVRFAKKNKAKIIAITNVIGSSLYREADINITIGAGPEISVVATKTFTCQLAVLTKLALAVAEKKLENLSNISEKIENILMRFNEIKTLAKKLLAYEHFFFIGRGNGYISALEGALKLKEITYLHAEAYPAGELKHGPLSLLDKNIAVIALIPKDQNYSKMLSNLQECIARNAKTVIFSDSKEALQKSDLHFLMPEASEEEISILYVIPLQLLAYFIAVELKRDPDKPRNLAKSVTVE